MSRVVKVANKRMSSVPREIIMEILKHLNVKTLMRLRCVSKLWCSIIDDPFFAHEHHSCRPAGINLLGASYGKLWTLDPHENIAITLTLPELRPDLDALLELDMDDLHHESARSITGFQSVNGLVCTGSFILNPSRREVKFLPLPRVNANFNLPHRNSKLDGMSWCCLGFDHSTKEYKVVNMSAVNVRNKASIRNNKRITSKIEDVSYKIMTIGRDDSWREIDNSSVPPPLNRFYVAKICCINDVIYWLGTIVETLDPDKRGENAVVMVAFGVRDEKFHIIDLPQGMNTNDVFEFGIEIYFKQVGEHVALIDTEVERIWILQDYTKQVWSMHNIYIPSFFREDCELIPVGTIHTDELVIKATSYTDEDSSAEFIYCNLKSGRWRVCKLYGLLENEGDSVLFTKHVETTFKLI